jgi:hypothetical protein
VPTGAIVTPLSRNALSTIRGQQALSLETARSNEQIITPMSFCSAGVDMAGLIGGTLVSSTYPAANRALAVPFEIAAPFLVRKVFWMNGTTTTPDSFDVGVYTEAGARLVSGGGTAISGASVTQEVDVTDTLLRPGRYWLACAQNGVTAGPVCLPLSANNLRLIGCAQMASAYTLPTTFTPAAIASANLPLIGIASRTLAS